jgi:hypothetical protein
MRNCFQDWEARQRPICVKTAYRWLARLGFTLADEQKGVYIDGHERQDVVDYRTDILLGRLCTQYEEVKGAWVATEPTLEPGKKRHVMMRASSIATISRKACCSDLTSRKFHGKEEKGDSFMSLTLLALKGELS